MRDLQTISSIDNYTNDDYDLRKPEFMIPASADVDDYDPRKPEFVIPATADEIKGLQQEKLNKQISSLQCYISARETDDPNSEVLNHYRLVARELQHEMENISDDAPPLDLELLGEILEFSQSLSNKKDVVDSVLHVRRNLKNPSKEQKVDAVDIMEIVPQAQSRVGDNRMHPRLRNRDVLDIVSEVRQSLVSPHQRREEPNVETSETTSESNLSERCPKKLPSEGSMETMSAVTELEFTPASSMASDSGDSSPLEMSEEEARSLSDKSDSEQEDDYAVPHEQVGVKVKRISYDLLQPWHRDNVCPAASLELRQQEISKFPNKYSSENEKLMGYSLIQEPLRYKAGRPAHLNLGQSMHDTYSI